MILRCDLAPQYRAYQDQIDEAVRRVLSSGRYVLGNEVAEFEKEFAQYIGVEEAVSVANGTDGLTLALMALGIGEGDEVITTAFTAVPTAAAIRDVGAVPVFVDVRADTFLLDVDQVARAVSPRTRAIIPVHIFGNVVDVPRLRTMVGSIPIIEDACQAHGSTLGGRRAGSMGDLAVFSFYPTKNLGAYGDGGMVMTRDPELAQKLRLLRMYGMPDKDHTVLDGINSRLDELQAAVLRVKLPYLDAMNARRRAMARRYIESLPAPRFRHQAIPPDVCSNYHVFVSRYAGDRKRLVAYLEREGVQTNIYYPIPLHWQPPYARLGRGRTDLPVVEKLCEEVIALPLYAELEAATLETVIERIHRFHERSA